MSPVFWWVETLPVAWPGASLVAQLIKNLPAVGETWVQSLGREDPLQKGKGTTPCSGLENSMACLYSPWGHKELDETEQLSLSLFWPGLREG